MKLIAPFAWKIFVIYIMQIHINVQKEICGMEGRKLITHEEEPVTD